MERIFEIVRVSDLLEKQMVGRDGRPYLLEKRQAILQYGADTLVADIVGPSARNFIFETGDKVAIMLHLKADCYKTQDGEERVSNIARVIDFVKLPNK